VNGRAVRAHRYAYEQLVGPIPEGLVLDHLCRNRLCINPLHLEPVTIGENIRRGAFDRAGKITGSKTHCANGHPFDEENTRQFEYHVKGRTGPARACRACARQRALAHYHRRQAARKAVAA
jgi:hypothetical protein